MLKSIKNFAIAHIEPRFYGALWLCGCACATAVVVLALYDEERFKDQITLLAAILAILIATIGWIWSGRMTVLMSRKTNAVALLERLSSTGVSALKSKAYPYIEAYSKFKRDDDCSERPEMPTEAIEQLLSVYEQVSVAVIWGAVDYDIIKNSQTLVFKRIYLGLCHHIERIQEKDGTYYENFEKLTLTWHPELQKRPAALVAPGGLFSPMRDADT